jgi:uncharacterized protein (TIGR02646 family)
MSKRAQIARAKVSEYFSQSSIDYISQSRFRFDSSVWIATKPALMVLTGNKCAYCESRLIDTQLVDVDHFRPKEGAENGDGTSDHPFYGWLAYEWENLLPACSVCNRRGRSDGRFVGKGRLFPVTGARASILSSVGQCRSEEADTLVDPSDDEPHHHLTFNEKGECVPKSKRGEISISIFGLNRQSLVRERAELRSRVMLAVERIFKGVATGGSESAIRDLCNLTVREAPYAGAARVFAVAAVEDRIAARHMPSDSLDLVLLLNWHFNQQRWARDGISSYYSDSSVFRQAPVSAEARPGMYEGREMLPAIAHGWVSQIEIRNFKAIDHLVLSVPRPSGEREGLVGTLVLLGENAAGKSSVLEAITLALLGVDAIRDNLDGKAFLQRDVNWQLTGEAAHVQLYFNNAEEPACWITIDPRTGEFHGTFDRQVVALAYGPRRFFSDVEAKDSPSVIFDNVRSIYESSATLDNPIGRLQSCSEDDFNAAIRALREVLMLPTDAVVRRENDPAQQMSGLSVFAHGRSTPIERMSEGYRSVVALTSSIIFEMLRYWPDLESAHGIVLIDEIDVHLHPRWKMRILRALRAAFPKVQFITTTHDPLCLRGAYDGEVQVLRRDEMCGVVRLENLPNVEGLTVEQLLTSDFFGMVSTESVDTELAVARFVALSSVQHRTVEDEKELSLLKDEIRGKMLVGQSPQQQLIYEAANEFLLKQRVRTKKIGEDAKGDTIDKMIDIWEALRNGKDPL